MDHDKQQVLSIKEDLFCTINKIKKCKVNIYDCQEFNLDSKEKELSEKIASAIVNRFVNNNQNVNEKHKKYITEIVIILLKGQASSKPDLIPLVTGGGKSTIIEEFLIYMLKEFSNYGAIVTKERNESLMDFANSINQKFNDQVVYTMHGFDFFECKANVSICIYTDCHYKDQCRYFNQSKESMNYPILAITHARLSNDNEKEKLYEKYNSFVDKNGKLHQRKDLFIDEKPTLIDSLTLTTDQVNRQFKVIQEGLGIVDDLGEWNETEVSKEFKKAIEMLENLFVTPNDNVGKRTPIQAINKEFIFSNNFWDTFRTVYDYSQECFKIPNVIQSIINNGGHSEVIKPKRVKGNKDNCVKQIIVHTTYNKKTEYPSELHTVIFDGTADIDFSYRHDKYRMFDFETIRTYENLTFYLCDSVKSSKKALSDDEMLEALCLEAIKIADENPNSKIYLPVYQVYKDTVRDLLSDYIERGRIKVAHFGSTKGSNEFMDCDIVLLGGIVHKTENYYIGLHNAKNGKVESNIYCEMQGGRRCFNNKEIEKIKVLDMLVDCSQEIARSSQRNNSEKKVGKVYVFTDNYLLLSLLPTKYPASKVKKWNPMKIYEIKMKQKRKHSQVINEPRLYDYWKSVESNVIYMADIMLATGLSKVVLSKKLKAPTIQALISESGFEIQNNPIDKRQKIYVRKQAIS
ncbi:hypothetical protein MJA45_03080 [Paenibacillus aurantius]|uniref:Uncharacterized protein n=1 Tax=Paenibacillus aurantius TaxID=2918900 RepID=A0AA96LEY1_9BACL|nr:hypothetical protein [Paenibacillus aurantius]WNQ12060.1 hypothetical protein MJA45_03080 [Paenibacillus aurantius]